MGHRRNTQADGSIAERCAGFVDEHDARAARSQVDAELDVVPGRQGERAAEFHVPALSPRAQRHAIVAGDQPAKLGDAALVHGAPEAAGVVRAGHDDGEPRRPGWASTDVQVAVAGHVQAQAAGPTIRAVDLQPHVASVEVDHREEPCIRSTVLHGLAFGVTQQEPRLVERQVIDDDDAARVDDAAAAEAVHDHPRQVLGVPGLRDPLEVGDLRERSAPEPRLEARGRRQAHLDGRERFSARDDHGIDGRVHPRVLQHMHRVLAGRRVEREAAVSAHESNVHDLSGPGPDRRVRVLDRRAGRAQDDEAAADGRGAVRVRDGSVDGEGSVVVLDGLRECRRDVREQGDRRETQRREHGTADGHPPLNAVGESGFRPRPRYCRPRCMRSVGSLGPSSVQVTTAVQSAGSCGRRRRTSFSRR